MHAFPFLILTVGCCVALQLLGVSSYAAAFASEEINGMQDDTILARRAGATSYQGAMAVETCFMLHGTPEEVQNRLQEWNASVHDSLGVYQHLNLADPMDLSGFGEFQLVPQKKEGRLFLGTSEKASEEPQRIFHLSSPEASKLKGTLKQIVGGESGWVFAAAAPLTSVWRGILSGRAQEFQASGLTGLSSYQTPSKSVKLSEEIRAYLKSRPGLLRSHGNLINLAMTGAKNARNYFEIIDIEGQPALLLGAYIPATTEGGKRQLIDMQYYVSNTLYGVMIIYDLERVSQGTRVSRKDIVFSPPFVSRGGIERMASENVLLQEVKKAIRYLRKDLS